MSATNLNDTINGAIDFNVLSKLSDQELTNLFGVRDYYVYELDFGTIAAGATAQATFTVQTDSNFLWQNAAFFANLDNVGTTTSERLWPAMTCAIQDTSSGRVLSSNPVPITSQFGTGERPFVLPSPRFFRANTQVTVTLQNFGTDPVTFMKLSFIGTKFFKYAQNI